MRKSNSKLYRLSLSKEKKHLKTWELQEDQRKPRVTQMICPDERPISHSFLPCILKYECEAEDKKRGALSSLFRQCLHFCSLQKLLVRSVPRSSRDTSLAKDNYRHHHHPRSNYSKRHGCFLSILTPLFKWLTCSFISLPIEHTQGLPLPSHHSSVTFLLRE